MPTLSATGNTPIAYKLLLNDTFPSWGYSIKHGATTIWERWDGWTAEKGFQDPGMNSFAHYSFGAVARWMFQTVAGIDMAEPGFQRLLIHPQPGRGAHLGQGQLRLDPRPDRHAMENRRRQAGDERIDSGQHDGHGRSADERSSQP